MYTSECMSTVRCRQPHTHSISLGQLSARGAGLLARARSGTQGWHVLTRTEPPGAVAYACRRASAVQPRGVYGRCFGRMYALAATIGMPFGLTELEGAKKVPWKPPAASSSFFAAGDCAGTTWQVMGTGKAGEVPHGGGCMAGHQEGGGCRHARGAAWQAPLSCACNCQRMLAALLAALAGAAQRQGKGGAPPAPALKRAAG